MCLSGMIEVPPLHSVTMERGDANQPAGVLAWPDIVIDMVRLRQAIEPEWDLEQWLIARATEELRIVEMDLDRELLRIIHRKRRVESIAEDLGHTLVHRNDEKEKGVGHQSNLFDHFDAILGNEGYERPTAGRIREDLIDLSPPDADDPMLRVVMRLIQHLVAEADAKDEMAAYGWILEQTHSQGLDTQEVEQAIYNLIESGGLIEIGNGEYIMGDE